MDDNKINVQHPGIILLNEYMLPYGLNANNLAIKLKVSPHTVRDIIKGKRGVSALMALRLARFFSTKPEYWLDLQMEYKLEQCYEKQRKTAQTT